MSVLEETDRKHLLEIFVRHPFLEKESRRRALLINCGLEHLLSEIETEGSPRDFVHLLYAPLLQNLTTQPSGEPWLASLLIYLVDFSGPENLTQEDRAFLTHLLQECWQTSAKRTREPIDNIRSAREEHHLPAPQIKTTGDRAREHTGTEQSYLRYVIKSLEWLEITGLPPGVVAQSAPLDEVFIPLQLRPNRPLTEYPLTEKELAEYHRRLKNNLPLRDLERYVFEAEKSWSTRQRKPIGINDFWQNLTRERPAAILQGYPGVGKSTLLKYLALSMARRYLKQRSRVILAPLTPPLIPFLVSLGDFANERTKKPDISLTGYLQLKLSRLQMPGLSPLLEESLEAGNCLILLDGLDEVSDHRMRIEIQTEIKEFILTYSDIFEESSLFNRFLVTTRVAGYDQAAFPVYPHYTIAELTAEQIDDFLPRWCRAIVRLDPAFASTAQNEPELFEREVQLRTEALQTSIHHRSELQTLVENPLDRERQELCLQIAVESLIEARTASIDPVLERQVAEQLLQLYEQAQRRREFTRCQHIEELIQRWLANLPKHGYHLTLLTVLYEAMSNTQRATYQRATLTLIAMLIDQQHPWPSSIPATLIPPLLALAGLPAIGEYQPAPELAASSDMVVADLALIILSLLGTQGPAGLLPPIVRQHFKDHPEQLRILAQHSVASNVLLTPTIIPRQDESSREWPGDVVLEQWLSQRGGYHTGYTQQGHENLCLSIHQDLLRCAEEMRYPLTLHIIQTLERAEQHSEQPWQRLWQDYLTGQMNSGQYISYQESALLWSTLFPELEELKKLVALLLEHLGRNGSLVQRYAQRFLATLGDHLRVQEELREAEELNLPGEQFLHYLYYWLDIRETLYMQDMQNLRYWRYLRDMHNLQNLRDVQGKEPLHNPHSIHDLQTFLFTHEVTKQCLPRLALASFDQDEYADLLTILLGRVLHILQTGAKDSAVEEELRQIVRAIRLDIPPFQEDERSAIVLDILRYLRFIPVYLPVSTPNEVCAVLQLAEKIPDEWLQQMCNAALQRAAPDVLKAGEIVKANKQTKAEQPEGLTAQQTPISDTTDQTPPSPSMETSLPHISSQEDRNSTPPLTREDTRPISKRAIGSDHPECDVCVICALSEEAEVFIREASRLCNVIFQKTFGSQTKREYRYATIHNNQGEPLTIYVTWPPRYGPEETSLHFKPVLAELKPRFAAMTGICAGDKTQVVLGDIIVVERAFLYDTGKIILGKRGRKKQLYDTNTQQPHPDILHFVRMFDFWKPAVTALPRPLSKRQQREWLLHTLVQPATPRIDDIASEELEQRAPDWRKIVHELQIGSNPYLTRERTLGDPAKVRELYYGKEKFPFQDPPAPKCYIAPLASGSAVHSDNPFDEIRVPVRGTIAIEMEGATFYRTVAEFPDVRALLVKGICDYANTDKDDSYHEYASAVSAIYMVCFIKDYVTDDLIPS